MIFPEVFLLRTKNIFEDKFDSFLEAFQEEPPVSIRMNPFKDGVCVTNTEKVSWASDACYLDRRPSFTLDPLFHAGCYYVQEASSMFLEQIIKAHVKEPVKCLDLCAAPGGKSTQLSSVLPGGSLLVANEVIRSRSQILSENLIKWGNPYTIVTNSDPEIIGRNLPGFFDLIVADVPCSGEGMFRKDKNAIQEWSLPNVKLCAERQRRIIADIWPSLKPGGILVYSTCTYNTEENEENIHWIKETFGAELLDIEIPEEWNIVRTVKYDIPVFRFIPGQTKGEGFFMAVVRKPDIPEVAMRRNKAGKDRNRKDKVRIPDRITHWVNHPDLFYFEENNGFVSAIPVRYKSDYLKIKDSLRIVHAGITIGEMKGKDVIPAHALAMSSCYNMGSFTLVEVDEQTAISYLRRDAISLPSHIEKGYVLLTYKKRPLGFMKNIGNRANNLYPQEWRIRMAK